MGEHNEDETQAKGEKKRKALRKKKHMKKKRILKKKKKKGSKSSKKHKRRRHSSSSSSDTSSSSSSEDDRKKQKKRLAKVESEQLPLLFNSDSSDVEEIVSGSGIYMKSAALSTIKRTAKSHKAAARSLIVGVFKPEALTECILKGHATKGPLGKTPNARPPLYGPGLDAVLEAAIRVAKSRKFEVLRETQVNHELSTKQSELRSAAKLQALLKP